MATTAGALTSVSVQAFTATSSSAVATGGTGPYTYQWYRSTTSGFTPGGGNIISGATSLTLADSGLIPNTPYYYKVIATDSGSVSGTSSQLAITTTAATISQNQFAQLPFAGVIDLKLGTTNVISAQADTSIGAGFVIPGQAVKIVANTVGGIPRVIPCTTKSDAVIGFAVYNIKDINSTIQENFEIALWGSVIWLYATAAITQFAQVCLDTTSPGGVQPTGNAATIVGVAMDGAASAGTLIRVMLTPNPSYATA